MGCSHTGRPPQLTRSCHIAAVPPALTFPKPASWGFADDPPRRWEPLRWPSGARPSAAGYTPTGSAEGKPAPGMKPWQPGSF